MKTMKRMLSLVLVVAMLMGIAVTASAAETETEIKYQEAVELMTALGVVDALGNKSLTATLTRNEAAAMINVLSTSIGRPISPVGSDYSITGEEFFTLMDAVLCKNGWFVGFRHVNAWLHNYLTGFGEEYDTLAGRVITVEEGCQIIMNTLDAKVEYGGNQWFLRDELGLTHEFSTDPANTDLWGRPVSRWTKDGVALTDWHTASAAWVGQGSITTHNLLERLGVFDFGEGNFRNNPWCMFHCVANGETGNTWSLPKLHWDHGGSGCEKNWISQRAGSRMEVYFLGEGYNYIPDTPDADVDGNVWSRNYYVVYIDEYLANITNQTIQIYSNEDGAIWSWSAPELPTTDGWYIINLNFKGTDVYAIPVELATANRSSQNGMELPSGDGYYYVYNDFGKHMVSSRCQLGYDIISSLEYFNNKTLVNFLYDTWGNVIGVIDGELNVPLADHIHSWSYLSRSEKQHEQYCEGCGSVQYVDHSGELTGKIEATEDTDGYTGDKVCADCGLVLETGVVVPAHAHNYGDTWYYDNETHWQICTVENCGYQGNYDEHDDEEICTVCGRDVSEDTGSNLSWLLGINGMPFEDVAKTDWFYPYVNSAYQKGLIDGMTKTTYAPNDSLTVAQAIKLSAALYQKLNKGEAALYNGEVNWYDPYVTYAVSKGIIEEKYLSYSAAQMNAPVSRQEFVHILYGANAVYGFVTSNYVPDNSIPDVKMGSAYASEIYELYRAGILTGSDAAGTFYPTSTIKRSEVAAILVRMYDKDARCYVSLG